MAARRAPDDISACAEISQLPTCAVTKMARLPLANTAAAAGVISMRMRSCAMRAMCGYSAITMPSPRQMRFAMRRRSCSGVSRNAVARLASTCFCLCERGPRAPTSAAPSRLAAAGDSSPQMPQNARMSGPSKNQPR